MRQLTLLTFVTGLLIGAPLAVATPSTDCPSDSALRDARFTIHPSANFEQLAEKVISEVVAAGDDFVYDSAGPIHSRYGHRTHETLILFSYDDVTTPQSTHYGDVVFVLKHEPNGREDVGELQKVSSKAPSAESLDSRLVEVRWWTDGTRQVVYNDEQVRCATHSLPMAENALY